MKTKERHAMLDIETLDTGPNAVVTSIGIAIFTLEKGVTEVMHCQLDYTTDIEGTISPSTLRWWLQQCPEAQRELHGETSIQDALTMVNGILRGCDTVWANAPTFDCTILRNLYRRHKAREPWHFRNERCCRTLYAIGLRFGIGGVHREGTRHNALDDAIHQAQHAVTVLRRIDSAVAE